jgi:hypothetical protein
MRIKVGYTEVTDESVTIWLSDIFGTLVEDPLDAALFPTVKRAVDLIDTLDDLALNFFVQIDDVRYFSKEAVGAFLRKEKWPPQDEAQPHNGGTAVPVPEDLLAKLLATPAATRGN